MDNRYGRDRNPRRDSRSAQPSGYRTDYERYYDPRRNVGGVREYDRGRDQSDPRMSKGYAPPGRPGYGRGQNDSYRRQAYGDTGSRHDPRENRDFYRDPRVAQNVYPRRDTRYSQGEYADRRRADPSYGDPRYADRRDIRGTYEPRRVDPRYGRQAGDYRPRPTEEERRREAARRAEYERRRRAAAEMRRRVEEQIKREKKMRRKRQRKIFTARATVTLAVFVILATLFTGVMAMMFFSSPDGEPGSIKYTFGGKEVRSASSETAYRNGKMYVCFNDLADYLDLSVTGDARSMKFVFPEADATPETGSEGSGREDYVTFFVDSRTVELNAQTVMLPSETYLYGEEVWVEAGFIREYIEGIDVDDGGDTISVARIADPDVTPVKGEETVYLAVGLKLKDHGAVPSPSDTDESADNPDALPNFTTDLSAYEQFMNPENADEYLILVNYENTVDATLAPQDLASVVNTRQDGRETQLMRLCAAKALEALYIEMYAAGYTDVTVMSGYRSYEYQSGLHEDYIRQEMAADGSLTYEAARQIVLTYSAAPGTSEHQTGLCVDMHNLPSASTDFASQPAYTWLCDNAWKFGFILRYPENKTDITQISFEPWHWRFVGRAHAQAIHDGGLSLEEYAEGLAE